MNINFHAIDKINSRIQLTGNTRKANIMDKKNTSDNETIKGLISDFKAAQSGEEAVGILLDAADKEKVQQISGNNFKSGNYYILNLFKFDAVPYAAKMKKISDLKLGIAPKQVDVVSQGNEYFIISQIDGCESGDLLPFSENRSKVSKDNLLAAYKDFQKLTKAGIADESVLRSTDDWYITPDDNRIVIPVWNNIRPLNTNLERMEALKKYHSMLFNE